MLIDLSTLFQTLVHFLLSSNVDDISLWPEAVNLFESHLRAATCQPEICGLNGTYMKT